MVGPSAVCFVLRVLHDVNGLNIKSFDHLYKECRSLSLSNVCFFSDGRTRHALDVKEQREGRWRRKSSPATFAKGLLQEVVTPVVSNQNVLTAEISLNDNPPSFKEFQT